MKRWLVTAGLMLAMFLAAVDGTIVSTALPTIVGVLHGFALLPWVGGVYLLASATTVPVYGKLADLYGRKRVLLFGIVTFLLGSALSGLSQTMLQLVVFRTLQGLGAGAVLPLASTIIGDIFNISERARMQGYFSSVWGLSAIAGPSLGGYLVDQLSWRWVFTINLPIGLLALLVIGSQYREHVPHQKHRIDALGGVLLVTSVSALMLALLQGGHAWAWTAAPSLGLLLLAGVTLLWFLRHEGRFPEPLVPLALFGEPLIAVASVVGLLLGVLIVGVSYYAPVFVQGVQLGSASQAGLVLTPMSMGWPLGSTLSGRALLRFGYRRVAIAGTLFSVLGTLFLTQLTPMTPLAFVSLSTFTIGFGLGLGTTVFLVAVQNAVPWNTRGVATASQQFVRSLGATLGLALLGSLLFARLGGAVRQAAGSAAAGPALRQVNLLLNPVTRAQVPDAVRRELQAGLFRGLQAVFWAMLVIALLAVLVVQRLPDRVPGHEQGGKPSDANGLPG